MSTVPRWRKSSHSSGEGGQCVEVAGIAAGQWHKSARSSGEGGACVEVAEAECGCGERAPVVAVRDSKDPAGPVLAFGPVEWRGLSARIKAGGFDLS